MKRHWVASDLHLGHELLARLRGFEDVDEHDDWLVERLNQSLSDKTTLWVLGDVSMSLRGLRPLKRVLGKKILIAGNHDRIWHKRSRQRDVRRAMKKIGYYYEYFTEVYTSGMILREVRGQEVVLSHLPVAGDHRETDRFKDTRPRPGDLPVLCGHVHKRWRTEGKQLNVGVDVNDFRPLQLISAVREVSELEGLGADRDLILPGPWNEFGLG